MSATGRGKKGGGESEFFPTPPFTVHRLLERLPLLGSGGDWLEPTAGDGAIIRAARATHPDVRWTAVELREECRAPLEATGAAVTIGNVLDEAVLPRLPTNRYDLALLNPPFSLALPIVRRCLELARQVAAIERLNWLESADRHAFFREQMPDVYVLGRVDFDGRGGDSIPYAWFVWPPLEQRQRCAGRIELLDLTPSVQRVPGNIPPPRQPSLFGGPT